jgi:MraZ protein
VASFSSTFINKIDSKGRVSVPASFRAILTGQSFNGVVLYPSMKVRAVEAGGIELVEDLRDQLDALAGQSDEYEALASMLPEMLQVPFDSEGRIILPPSMLEHAGIIESAAFAGYGRTFRIWDPERLRRHQQEMRELVRDRGFTLPPRRAPK